MKLFGEWLNEKINPEEFLTKEQIEWCNDQLISKWRVDNKGRIISNDLMINITNDTVNKHIPVQFMSCKMNFCVTRNSFFIDLKGTPKYVNSDFEVHTNPNMTSLKGSPTRVGGNYILRNLSKLSTLMYSPERIDGKIMVSGCPLIPQEELEMTKDKQLFSLWMKSKLSFDEFKKKYHGAITGHKFGI